MGKVRSKREASGKRKKGVATDKERGQEPNVQPNDERDLKQNVVATMNSLG